MGPSWGVLGLSWDHFGVLGLSWGGVLGPSGGHLGAIVGGLGAILGSLGAILRGLGAILGGFWGHLEGSWSRPADAEDGVGVLRNLYAANVRVYKASATRSWLECRLTDNQPRIPPGAARKLEQISHRWPGPSSGSRGLGSGTRPPVRGLAGVFPGGGALIPKPAHPRGGRGRAFKKFICSQCLRIYRIGEKVLAGT